MKFFIFILIFSLNSFAQDKIQAFLEVKKLKEVKLGDIFEAKVILFPVSFKEDFRFQNLNSKEIGEGVYIASSFDQGLSPNYQEAYVIQGLFVLTDDLPKLQEVEINIEGVKAWLNFKNLKILDSKGNKRQKFHIMNQGNLSSGSFSWWWLCLLIPIIIFAYFLFIKRKRKDEKITLIHHWSKRFESARSREDFEEIYMKKSEWVPLVKGYNASIEVFFTTLNKHQFRKNFEKKHLDEISHYFDKVRGIFDGV